MRADGKEISITRMERNLLLYFLLHPNRALSRDQLLKEVWGYELPGSSRTVDSHVKKLRRDLGGFGSDIVTVRGVGYRLETGGVVIDCPGRAAVRGWLGVIRNDDRDWHAGCGAVDVSVSAVSLFGSRPHMVNG